jgi:NAD(P)-dependent dehydrogenase (short-subunit alcohol dehydrogenase family)
MSAALITLVTGASRGAGRGIARALGRHGATVYVTGRTAGSGAGTVNATAAEVTAAGGKGIAVACDHGNDAQVAALFAQIEAEQGRLDLLVNNACAIDESINAPGSFFEKPLALADMISVGVRSAYVASWHAARLMAVAGKGLIAFTSSPGAVHYCLGPAYGAHKAGLDKLAADMAVDLRDHGIATVSVWMGPLATERLLAMIETDPERYGHLRARLETPDFTGHVLWEMLHDPALVARSGEAVIGAEMGGHYGLVDEGGRRPASARDTMGVAPRTNYPLVIR